MFNKAKDMNSSYVNSLNDKVKENIVNIVEEVVIDWFNNVQTAIIERSKIGKDFGVFKATESLENIYCKHMQLVQLCFDELLDGKFEYEILNNLDRDYEPNLEIKIQVIW